MKKINVIKLIGLLTLLVVFISQVPHVNTQNVVKEIKTKFYVEQDFNTTSDYGLYSLLTRTFIIAESTSSVVITPTRVNYSIVNKVVDGWAYGIGMSDQGTQIMSTTIPREEFDYSVFISYMNLDSFLLAQFVTEYYVKGLVNVITKKFYGNITKLEVNINYIQVGYFDKIPVLVFKGNGYLEAKSPFAGNVTASFNGYLYLYTALLLPVYGSIEYRILGKAIGLTRRVDSKTTYKLTEFNFDRIAKYGYYNISGLEIIIGGFPESNITIYGYANQSQLIIKNTGRDIGYVLIRSVEPIIERINGLMVEHRGFKIYGILGNSSRVVNITQVLDRDIVLNTTLIYLYEKPFFTDPVFLTITTILVIATASFIIIKYSKSPRKYSK